MYSKKISVIVPVYNPGTFLPFCIESIINQTYKNLEIILIDDGSTDSSLKICEEYSKKDHRIKVIHQENHGISYVRNLGIESASSDYISFIDSDDIISPYFYEHLLNILINNNADIAECSFTKLSEADITNYTFPDFNPQEFSIFDSIESLHRIHNENLDICVKSVIVCNKLYKISLFDDIRFPLGKRYEDELTTYKLFYKSKRLVSSSAILYGYIQHKSSFMNQPFNVNRLTAIDVYENYMSFFRDLKDKELIEKCERRYLRLLFQILTELDSSNFSDKLSIQKTLQQKFDNIYVPDNPDEKYTVKPLNMLQSKLYYYNKFYKLLNGGNE